MIDFPEFVKLMEDQKKPDEREADMMLAFRIFDADNKGYIESAELRYIILNMDNKIPQEELEELITIADLERDRKLTYQGTLTYVVGHVREWMGVNGRRGKNCDQTKSTGVLLGLQLCSPEQMHIIVKEDLVSLDHVA